jgi:hypothetical protein
MFTAVENVDVIICIMVQFEDFILNTGMKLDIQRGK